MSCIDGLHKWKLTCPYLQLTACRNIVHHTPTWKKWVPPCACKANYIVPHITSSASTNINFWYFPQANGNFFTIHTRPFYDQSRWTTNLKPHRVWIVVWKYFYYVNDLPASFHDLQLVALHHTRTFNQSMCLAYKLGI
jgi:hypothetical protein